MKAKNMDKIQVSLKVVGSLIAAYISFMFLLNGFVNTGSQGYHFDFGQFMIWLAGILLLIELTGLWLQNNWIKVITALIGVITLISVCYVEITVFVWTDMPTIVLISFLSLITWALTFMALTTRTEN